MEVDKLRTTLLTAIALTAFAANSVLCRLALGEGTIDAAGFTGLRLLTGALMLLAIGHWRGRGGQGRAGSWLSAFWLFLYAAAFSFAYLTLSTGTGALILFGAVQATMILSGLRSGERPRPAEWAGLVLAFSGLIYLVLPGLSAPSPVGSALMVTAGVAWGAYSLQGRRAGDPLPVTGGNFLRSIPFVILLCGAFILRLHLTPKGVLLATASGALASGGGYVVWYAALRGLTATLGATVQLAVPVLAGLGGVVLLGEAITPRLVLAATAILGGVGLAVAGRARWVARRAAPRSP